MAFVTKSLPVALIPEQMISALMRDDVINHSAQTVLAVSTDRIVNPEEFREPPPSMSSVLGMLGGTGFFLAAALASLWVGLTASSADHSHGVSTSSTSL